MGAKNGKGAAAKENVWEEFYKQHSENAKNAHKAYLEDQKALSEHSAEFNKSVSAKNKEIALKLWKKYDENHDGDLQLAEIKKLLKDALIASKDWTPNMCLDMMNNGIEILYKKESKNQDLVVEMRNLLKQSQAAMKKAVEKRIDRFIEDSDELAVQMWKRMDTNGDGKVSQQEFVQNYNKAFTEIIDPVALTNALKDALIANLT